MPRYGKAIPEVVQLYFRCIHCNKEWEWPKYKASKYCDRTCSNAAYYLRTKQQTNTQPA